MLHRNYSCLGYWFSNARSKRYFSYPDFTWLVFIQYYGLLPLLRTISYYFYRCSFSLRSPSFFDFPIKYLRPPKQSHGFNYDSYAISDILISNHTFLLISIPKCLIHPSFWRSPTGILNSILKLSHSFLPTTLPPLTHVHYLPLLPQKTESAPAGFSYFSKWYHSLPRDLNPRKRLLYPLS